MAGGAAVALALAGCAETSQQTGPGANSGASGNRPNLTVRQVDYKELPGWNADRHERALVAFRRSCPKLGFAWARPCQALAAMPRGDRNEARQFFERYFDPHLITNFGGQGFLTGYYEPILDGARQRGGKYQTPLHLPPPDLATKKPYPTRAQLLAPPLRGSLRALVWLADPVDAFTLHIQGSGRIRLAKGGTMRVGVGGTNGHTYVSIGRIMLREGTLTREQATMQGIRAWLSANPRRAQALMNRNPRYIFFREVAGDGPVGSHGAALTSRRSLAIDKRYIPLGSPVWLDGRWPDGVRPLRRLVIAQDTGAAIVGPVRGDLYMGSGPQALAVAGRMRQPVRFFVLVPRGGTISAYPGAPSAAVAAAPSDRRSGK
ncbi:MAG TPA: MltA domain-containing protein [Alphaproteobacteria bacterium]|nr:MltA domain-containing protein [Alphaproteobacteria bacterium]